MTTTDTTQDLLADSAARYVERGYTPAVRAASLSSPHACHPQRWQEFAELGWLALPLPEGDAGLGGTVADLCRLAEALGPATVAEPLLSNGLVAASLLADAGTPAQQQRWLPLLASGERRIAWAAWDAGQRFDALRLDTRAVPVADGWRLSGRKALVLGGGGADALVVSARVDAPGQPTQPGLFIVDAAAAGLSWQPYAMFDGRHAAHVALDDVVVGPDACLDARPAGPAIARALDLAMVVHAAEAAGAMAAALQITLDYLRTRKQFGRPLAGNQALQHRLVDLHVLIEETRALVQATAEAFDNAPAQRPAQVAATKAHASMAARQVWEECVQMHGAIGMTDDYALGRLVKHLAAFCTLFGDADHHLERLADIEADAATATTNTARN
ncbi:MAG: acyl-CoA dehydrogenase family protein [Aquabacterium sp.]